jgi:hypothetical protein
MQAESSTLGQWWTNGKQDALALYSIFALGVGLLVLVMAIVFVFAVMPHTELDVSLGTATGIGVNSAPWSLLGGYFSGEPESRAADVARWNIVSEWPTAEVIQGP